MPVLSSAATPSSLLLVVVLVGSAAREWVYFTCRVYGRLVCLRVCGFVLRECMYV